MNVQLSLQEKTELLHSRIDQVVNLAQGFEFEREQSRPLGEIISEVNELWTAIRVQIQDCIEPPAPRKLTEFDLAVGYHSNFVDDEETERISLNLADEKPQSIFQLAHKPMIKGTLVGTVFVGNNAIYTFASTVDGQIVLREIGDVLWTAEKIVMDWNQGIITVQWEEGHGYPVWLKVSYEYNANE